MTTSRHDTSKELPWWILFLLSYVIFVCAVIIDHALRWTDHYMGLVSGLIQGSLCGIVWGIVFVLPWSLFVCFAHRKRKWSRSRSTNFLAPSYLLLLIVLGLLIVVPPTAKQRFKEDTKVEMPTEISGLSYNLRGGGFVDVYDTFYFQTSPKEVDRLIEAMHLTVNQSDPKRQITPWKKLPNAPDPKDWKEALHYNYNDQSWFFDLIVNSSKTEVYIYIGQI